MSVRLNIAARPDGNALECESQVLRFHRVVQFYGIGEMILVGFFALMAAHLYWSQTFNIVPKLSETLLPSVLIAMAVGMIDMAGGRLNLALSSGPAFLWSAVGTTLKAFAVLIAAFFLLKISDSYSRATLITQFVVVMMTILAMRTAFQKFLRTHLAKGSLETDRIVVIGALANDSQFLNCLKTNGARIVSTFPLNDASQDAFSLAKDVVTACRTLSVNQVVIAPSSGDVELARLIVEALAETPVTVHVVPLGVQLPSYRQQGFERMAGLPTAVVYNRPLGAFDLIVKRAFDLVVSFGALVMTSPVFLFVAIAIRLESAGPVFFRQTRHGYGNRPIRVFKFRSMRVMEDGKAFRQATRDDPRITKVGRFIRKTNLDELPQLFNVLLGEMSIVGPRPHPVALNESFSDQIKWFNRRHNIRPGITGWAQISGYRGETETMEKMVRRIEHDLWYLDNWSVFLDLKIIVLTVFSPMAYRSAN